MRDDQAFHEVGGQIFPTLVEIIDEILRARGKHGDQRHLPASPGLAGGGGWLRAAANEIEIAARVSLNDGPTWIAIWAEEVGEALRETDPAKRRTELVQVAAMTFELIAAIDREAGR